MTLHHHISKRGATFAVLAAALLAGCSSVPLDTGAPVETRTAGTAGSAGGTTGGAGTSKVEPVDLTKGAGNLGSLGKVIEQVLSPNDVARAGRHLTFGKTQHAIGLVRKFAAQLRKG